MKECHISVQQKFFDLVLRGIYIYRTFRREPKKGMAPETPLDFDISTPPKSFTGGYTVIIPAPPAGAKIDWKTEVYDCFQVVALFRYVIFCPCYCCCEVMCGDS